MITRPIWSERIASSWRKAPIVWLAGPRRTGKTVIGDKNLFMVGSHVAHDCRVANGCFFAR